MNMQLFLAKYPAPFLNQLIFKMGTGCFVASGHSLWRLCMGFGQDGLLPQSMLGEAKRPLMVIEPINRMERIRNFFD